MKIVRVSDESHTRIKAYCKKNKLKMHEFAGNACISAIEEFEDKQESGECHRSQTCNIMFEGTKYCCVASAGSQRLVYEIIEGQVLRTFDTLTLTDEEFEEAKEPTTFDS